MDTAALGFALAAGMVAAFNPCGFAMLPAYLALVVTDSGSAGRAVALRRALAATAAMTVGFVAVFGAAGLVLAPLLGQVGRYLPVVTVVIGAVLAGAGVWLLLGRELLVRLPRIGGGAPTSRIGSMLGYGVVYAVASLSCTIGPFLAVTGIAARGRSATEGFVAFVAYGLGMAAAVGAVAVLTALAGAAAAARTRKALPHVSRAAGGLMVVAGAYVAYYGVYELRLFFGDGTARDPVIDAALAVQQQIAGWVDGSGAALLVLAAAAAAALAGTVAAVKRRGRNRADAQAPGALR